MTAVDIRVPREERHAQAPGTGPQARAQRLRRRPERLIGVAAAEGNALRPPRNGDGIFPALVPPGLAALATVAGDDLGASAVAVRHMEGGTTLSVGNVGRRPAGVLLALPSASVIFRGAPRRRRLGHAWPVSGAAVSIVRRTSLTSLPALHLRRSHSFDTVHGPLSTFTALLLRSCPASLALFLGLSFAARPEAVRALRPGPVRSDPGA
jgi:hypothetical protein